MRSWILTSLGALLAVMLWRVAQGIPTRERFTADQVAEMAKQVFDEAKAAGKDIPLDLRMQIGQANLVKDDEAKVREIFNNVRSKLGLSAGGGGGGGGATASAEDPKVTKLTELVEDARKRIGAIEADLEKKKTAASEASATAEKLKELAQ